MGRPWSIILGFGLVLIGAIGIIAGNPPAWMGWADIGLGIICMMVGTLQQRARGGLPLFLSIGTFVLWLVQMFGYPSGWLGWWNFGFACVFLIGAFSGFGGSGRTAVTRAESRNHLRKAG